MVIAEAPDMEPIQLQYSFKNIRNGSKHEYLCKLYEQTSKFVNRIRWKAYWYRKGNDVSKPDERKRIFPSNFSAPSDEGLNAFENDLYSIIDNIEFRRHSNPLTEKMSKDQSTIFTFFSLR